MVFCSTVAHAEHVTDAFRTAGVSAALIHGDLAAETRKAILADYAAGDIRVVVNVAVLTEGWPRSGANTPVAHQGHARNKPHETEQKITVVNYGVLTFSISVGTYSGEVLRAAMRSVPQGELEAARAYGMARWKIVLRIWLPRAIQICLPTLTGEAILLLKSVPLVSTIAVVDLLKAANIVRSETFLVYEPLLLVAGIYVALAIVTTFFMRMIERRFPGARPATRKATKAPGTA